MVLFIYLYIYLFIYFSFFFFLCMIIIVNNCYRLVFCLVAAIHGIKTIKFSLALAHSPFEKSITQASYFRPSYLKLQVYPLSFSVYP